MNNSSKDTIKRIEQLVNMKELQLELLDNLGAAIMWILDFRRKTGIAIPNIQGLQYLLHRINVIMNIMYPADSPTQNQHDFKHEDDSTEPKNAMRPSSLYSRTVLL